MTGNRPQNALEPRPAPCARRAAAPFRMRLCRDRLRVARESAAPSLGVVPQELLCVPRDVRADKGPPSNVHNKTVEAYSFRGGVSGSHGGKSGFGLGALGASGSCGGISGRGGCGPGSSGRGPLGLGSAGMVRDFNIDLTDARREQRSLPSEFACIPATRNRHYPLRSHGI